MRGKGVQHQEDAVEEDAEEWDDHTYLHSDGHTFAGCCIAQRFSHVLHNSKGFRELFL